jgi:N-acylneuraminate cytidylyltransferase/CMP-N,N'-diacetyllegionaminic acid synthase
MMNVLFLIPARGGSKGLPGKNIKEIAGKPLIAWSIDAAKIASSQLENARVIVSTDSEEIAKVALQFGAEIPFMRPKELAEDNVGHMDVVLHAIEEMEKQHFFADVLIMVEPTSPQRDANDLIGALNLLNSQKDAESLVGVSKAESSHPMFLTKLNNHFLDPYENKNFVFYRRQEIDQVYFYEGSMYISKVESLKKRKSFYHEKTLGYTMPKWKSFEIDDLTDFIIVERLLIAKAERQIQ